MNKYYIHSEVGGLPQRPEGQNVCFRPILIVTKIETERETKMKMSFVSVFDICGPSFIVRKSWTEMKKILVGRLESRSSDGNQEHFRRPALVPQRIFTWIAETLHSVPRLVGFVFPALEFVISSIMQVPPTMRINWTIFTWRPQASLLIPFGMLLFIRDTPWVWGAPAIMGTVTREQMMTYYPRRRTRYSI